MKRLNWLLVAVTVAISAYAVHVTQRTNSLRNVALALQSDREQARDLLSDERILRSRVGVLLRRQDFYVRKLGELLSYCHSRDEFLVREGPWLVVGKLKTADVQSQHFGVYLPAGRHILKYAIADFSQPDEDRQQARQQFFSDTPHQLTDVHSFVLEGSPEVFELRFSWRTAPGVAGVRLQVVGKENKILFDRVQRLHAQQVKINFPVKKYGGRYNLCTAAYPGELLVDRDSPRKPADGYRPYTRLIELRGSTGHIESGGFRAWIESEAPPCISALTLGRHFDAIMSWREPTPIKQLDAFDDLFLPYNGSGRYVLRPGAIEALTGERDGTRSFDEGLH